uniref:Uncharacterized protein n=1 Tax=Ditylenchus dipsaci TaxID=166011 RepID=A0A915D1L6_9BILA
MGQPPPVMTTLPQMNSYIPPRMLPSNTGVHSANPTSMSGLQPIPSSEMSQSQSGQYMQQQYQPQMYDMSSSQGVPTQHPGSNYPMQQARGPMAPGIAKTEHNIYSSNATPMDVTQRGVVPLSDMQQQHQQHRGWNNMQQQPNPQMVSTGGYSQPISGPNGTFQPSMEQGYGGVQHDIVRQLKGLGEEEKPYYEKICQLQMYTNMLHDRAKTFQMNGYGQMVNRIEYALAMLRFERIGNLEHARGIETLIRKLAQQNVSAQPNAHQQQYMHQQQQPPQQMMDNPMAYPQHQMASHQQQWQGWQQHQPPPQDTVGKPQSQTVAPVSGGGPIQPTSQQQHHPYISPSSSASYSAANRPAPYPLPSHQPK